MNTVNTEWNCGNFTVALRASVDDDTRDVLANLGLRFLGQRNTEVDKILGAFMMGPKGKPIRKPQWKRNDVAYDATLADALRDSFRKLALPDSDDAVLCTPTVAEYIRDVVESKFTEERAIAAAIESAADDVQAEKLKAIRWTAGIDAIHTEDGEDYSREFLLAIRARKLEKRKADLTAI